MRPRMKRILWIAPLATLGMLLFAFIGGELVMRLWNWLTPCLFGWRQITFWQALGLLALCRILFGGMGMMRGASSRARQRVAERLEQMTPEEREKFRQGLRGGCAPLEPPNPKPTA